MDKKISVVIIVLLTILVGLCLYVIYDNQQLKKSIGEELKQINQEINKLQAKKTNKNEKTENSSCEKHINATFYGESSGVDEQGNLYDIKETLTLKSDGTFKVSFVNSQSDNGTYNIENEKITLIYPKTAMNDASVVTYDITDNCTTINNTEQKIILKRK